MKVIAFAGSTSSKSINKQLVTYAAGLLVEHEVTILDLNNYEVTIFSEDKERDQGIPKEIEELASLIDASDLVLLSLAEHNGSYTAAFKNTYDWLSRIPNRKVFGEKPVALMAASPGGRGGAGVLEAASTRIPRDGSELVAQFSFPRFYDNFNEGKIVDVELDKQLKELMANLT